jgi:hypothetical protein
LRFFAHQRVGIIQGALNERRSPMGIKMRQRPQSMCADERLWVLLDALNQRRHGCRAADVSRYDCRVAQQAAPFGAQ